MKLSLGSDTLDFVECGAGPPLVFLHGEEGPRGPLPHLTGLAARFRVLSPVLPGIGASTRPDWVESVPTMAKYLLRALDALAVKNAVLAGASLGGWIAAEIATMAPERVSRLVLIGGQGIATGHLGVPDLFTTPYRRYLDLAAVAPTPKYKKMFGDPPSDQDLDTDLETLELAARLGFKPYMHDRALLPALSHYGGPTTLIWGERDPITPRIIADQFKAALPQATIVVVPAAGHYVHIEQPEAFVAALAKD
jgi:pimeloyl-ACP methyl ester carboxylesterase